ncbi:deoxyribonuclease [Plakobranchus ocellatus]|uniref:Deoxyribonuclease n=1 Tax=Plakobranchus ocellatus TaxID=259542 RepID=A0AAV4BMH4_9GAST|nr:deoxyribonuclease [Plakobranchus ocellatus]
MITVMIIMLVLGNDDNEEKEVEEEHEEEEQEEESRKRKCGRKRIRGWRKRKRRMWKNFSTSTHAQFIDAQQSSPVRVASFNIKQFGESKMSKPAVAENIVRILKRYDIVFVMETRDKDQKSLEQLKKLLGAAEWTFVASDPIGRTSSYKEQYVFFFRPHLLTLQDKAIIFQDDEDKFEREPIVAQFEYWSSFANAKVKVTFVGAHLDPDDVVNELNALPDVIATAESLFPTSSAVIVMGDFNSDCTYMNCEERAETALFSTPEVYTSLVPDKTDTTVSHNTDCAYDRVVITVHDRPKVKVTKVKAFNFEKELGLQLDEAQDISDHYPVEFILE